MAESWVALGGFAVEVQADFIRTVRHLLSLPLWGLDIFISCLLLWRRGLELICYGVPRAFLSLGMPLSLLLRGWGFKAVGHHDPGFGVSGEPAHGRHVRRLLPVEEGPIVATGFKLGLGDRPLIL